MITHTITGISIGSFENKEGKEINYCKLFTITDEKSKDLQGYKTDNFTIPMKTYGKYQDKLTPNAKIQALYNKFGKVEELNIL